MKLELLDYQSQKLGRAYGAAHDLMKSTKWQVKVSSAVV